MPLSPQARYLVLAAAFLGWMFAGWEMSLLPLAARSATIGLLQQSPADREWVTAARRAAGGSSSEDTAPTAAQQRLESLAGQWFARYIAAFLLGAALGGLVFGWLGDRYGRSTAMGWSILVYALLTGLSYFVNSPSQLAVMRFLACMGIGGMWPNGVALVSEAWSDVSRPTLAGLIGTSANVGIALLGLTVRLLAGWDQRLELTPDSWRWILLLGAAPFPLGLAILAWVPESPRWISSRDEDPRGGSPVAAVFRPPWLARTLVGIALGTVPLLGAWGAQKWILPWAGQVGAQLGVESLKADTQTVWAVGAALGSLCGGWIAHAIGRRFSYFLVSVLSLGLSAYIFRSLDPGQGWRFLGPVFLLGLVSTVYFGWLPLFLPELFPTSVRATGTGVAFNFGRILSAVVVLTTVGLVAAYDGDYARIGATTSLVYVFGMVVIVLAPASTQSVAGDEP